MLSLFCSLFLGETEHLPCTRSLHGCYPEAGRCGPCPAAQKSSGSWGISCSGLTVAGATSSLDRHIDVRQRLCPTEVWGNGSSSGMSHARYPAACLVPCLPLAVRSSGQYPQAPGEGCQRSCVSRAPTACSSLGCGITALSGVVCGGSLSAGLAELLHSQERCLLCFGSSRVAELCPEPSTSRRAEQILLRSHSRLLC